MYVCVRQFANEPIDMHRAMRNGVTIASAFFLDCFYTRINTANDCKGICMELMYKLNEVGLGNGIITLKFKSGNSLLILQDPSRSLAMSPRRLCRKGHRSHP